MAAKDIKKIVNILTYAGIAKPTAKLGQALGPLGLNMAQVCKELNEMTNNIRTETPIKAKLYARFDKTYTLEVQSPPTSWFIKRASGIAKGSPAPGREDVGIIDVRSIYEIAKVKQEMDKEMQKISLQSICNQIAGTCKSMGVKIVEDRPKPNSRRILLRKIGQK